MKRVAGEGRKRAKFWEGCPAEGGGPRGRGVPRKSRIWANFHFELLLGLARFGRCDGLHGQTWANLGFGQRWFGLLFLVLAKVGQSPLPPPVRFVFFSWPGRQMCASIDLLKKSSPVLLSVSVADRKGR